MENWPTMGAAISLPEWRLSAAGQCFFCVTLSQYATNSTENIKPL
jgi:hypothetical protein